MSKAKPKRHEAEQFDLFDQPKKEPGPFTAEDILNAMHSTLAEDVLLALRYFYYVKAHPLIPDKRYDDAEREYLSRKDSGDALAQPGSDIAEDYPERVRALAFYLYLSPLVRQN